MQKTPEIHPKAQRAIIEIWKYTAKTWNEEQANSYVYGLRDFIKSLPKKRNLWSKVDHESFYDVFFLKYKRHFVFFKLFEEEKLGIVSILHENMDLPNRLIEDIH